MVDAYLTLHVVQSERVLTPSPLSFTPLSFSLHFFPPPTQSGTLIDVGFLSPHAYGPNELFAQNWIFEGLVSYGPDGAILPALATSWQLTTNGDSTVDLTFQLRQNVIFHDGQQWNASVCKLNFDNVFAPALAATYHSWYDLPTKAIRWSVAGPFTFVVTLSGPYYPALNEFTFIRPLRFLSPAAFVPGVGVNSCPASRGNVTARNSWVLCSGTLAPYGTGPWIFEVRERAKREIKNAPHTRRNSPHLQPHLPPRSPKSLISAPSRPTLSRSRPSTLPVERSCSRSLSCRMPRTGPVLPLCSASFFPPTLTPLPSVQAS